ncbi:hypothetical protein ACLB2K_012143 [Fragaria x ananassa]
MGKWKPVKASGSGPPISHLFFANDLILFAKANCAQARIIKKCLDAFCNLSGQEVSFQKSMLYCSPNTSKKMARKISRICGSALTDNLGKYLGMPLIHSTVTKKTYRPIVEKVQSKLVGWKSKTLNFVGRLTLVQAVTSTIPIYAMQTAKLPVATCDSLDKLSRDFLLGDCDEKKKVHLINWDRICKPKGWWFGIEESYSHEPSYVGQNQRENVSK